METITAITINNVVTAAFSLACRLRGSHLGTNVSHERCSLPDYSVSFMSEFHEVKCPDHIGRVAGNG